METLGIGIVGMGDGGKSNYLAIRRTFLCGEPVRVVAVCDNRPLPGIYLPNERVRFCGSDEELSALPEVGLVVVATPDDRHLAVARRALERGRYVFVEKPLATTLEDIALFSRLADQFPGKLLFSEKYSFALPVRAALARREELGAFMTGHTSYRMWDCDRIMGAGKWRTEHAYNPAAGGLSHNFMTLLLFTGGRIAEVWASGQVLTYHELKRHGGFDAMRGVLRLDTGAEVSFDICLALQGRASTYGHRTVLHDLQFRNGALAYGPTPECDRLVVGKEHRLVPLSEEVEEDRWGEYNLDILYGGMWGNIIHGLLGKKPLLHSVEQGMNVAAACAQAFQSARRGGQWLPVPY